ncbi:hypothetical protein HMPREF9700_02033 [Bergeyella zoohelcum CCUG 30536]|uniref:Uncharacterized protein n=1 Tax=Bergeyella zoohelcum TaxID=1015 RepID=A0A376C186_9FLAO|nr:hypothetical protein HMPREF9700_02033 [Bergeyella zoohelcum CCUG 30536]SSZ55832.1 Uncharacterised protein [Bergeyella zoohelcum]
MVVSKRFKTERKLSLETFARTVHPPFFLYSDDFFRKWGFESLKLCSFSSFFLTFGDDFNQNLPFLSLFFIKRQDVFPSSDFASDCRQWLPKYVACVPCPSLLNASDPHQTIAFDSQKYALLPNAS